MKKLFMTLLSILFMAAMSVGFASCGDDDEKINSNTVSSFSKILRENKWIGGDSDVTPTSYGGSISRETDIFYFLDGNQGYWRWISSEYDSSMGNNRRNGWEHFTYTVVSGNTVKVVFDNGSASQVMTYNNGLLISESLTFRLRQANIPADDEIYDFLKGEGDNDPTPEPVDIVNPLTLEAIGNGTITFQNRAAGKVMYKIDGGMTQTIASGADRNIPVTAGQKITLYGNNATYSPLNSSEDSHISSTTDFYAYGNIMSLISSNNYNTETRLTASYTFSGLFTDNTNLHSHPSIPLLLPATTLTENCYDGMFSGCSNLTTAPVLPAKTLVKECYNDMFYECSKLNHIECLASGINGNSFNYEFYMYNWVYGVSASGTFVKATDSSWTKDYSGIPYGWTVSNDTGGGNEDPNTDPGEEGEEPVYPDINSTPLTLEAISGGTITFKNKAARSVTYRIDGESPQVIASNKTIDIPLTAGQKVRFFGDNATYYVGDNSHITCNVDCYLYGNIMSLIYSKDYATNTTLTKDNTFAYFFSDNVNLNSHPSKQLVLPALTLTNYCYDSMFSNCTNMTIAPKLPATTMAERCYDAMFSGCKNLTFPPELPATTLANGCYLNMFSRCVNLTSAPKLPAKNLAKMCYQSMFNECSSLTAAPTLPAMTMVERCYFAMFLGCSSLTDSPKLPSNILAKQCYASMFSGCTSLVNAPQLPAITLAESCYHRMFAECTALTNAPILPATIMTKSCYGAMFSRCKSLTTAPELKAMTLAESCYSNMFQYCSNLNYVKCLATNTSATDCTINWLYNVSSTGTFVKKSGTSWSSGSNGIPSGWTVQTQ